jgi:hypothetical protein
MIDGRVGYLDGDEHGRDQVSHRNLLKAIFSVSFFTIIRPWLVVFVAGWHDNWDFSTISPCFPWSFSYTPSSSTSGFTPTTEHATKSASSGASTERTTSPNIPSQSSPASPTSSKSSSKSSPSRCSLGLPRNSPSAYPCPSTTGGYAKHTSSSERSWGTRDYACMPSRRDLHLSF